MSAGTVRKRKTSMLDMIPPPPLHVVLRYHTRDLLSICFAAILDARRVWTTYPSDFPFFNAEFPKVS
ncbi:hypothetical protein C0993_007450 [Termitomyces sp. T159_Od127]|nr:hypothetical protein C0993_007450 [Termitomyces sp. T159_Od127]